MLESLLLILPVFLIIALGVVADLTRLLPRQTGGVIGNYVLYVALPLLLIHILGNSPLGDILHGGFWAGILGSLALVYFLGYFGELLLGRRGHGPAVIMALTSSCSNVAFMGLPVVISLLPGNHEALVAAGIAVISPNLAVTPALIKLECIKSSQSGGATHLGKLIRNILLNPLILATVVGIALAIAGTGLWGPLDKAAKMIGDTTAPCMLLALGLDLREKIRVAFSGGKRFGLSRLMAVSVVKLVVHPLLTWGLLALFGVGGTWLVVGVIMAGTGTALVTYVIAEVYGQVPEEAAMIAVVTNVLNVATLSILAAVMRSMGLL